MSGKRWTLVLDAGAAPQRRFTVRDARDADEVMLAVRTAVKDLAASGGCRSIVLGIHVEGPACDHELPSGG
jgi:hypothetical protein